MELTHVLRDFSKLTYFLSGSSLFLLRYFLSVFYREVILLHQFYLVTLLLLSFFEIAVYPCIIHQHLLSYWAVGCCTTASLQAFCDISVRKSEIILIALLTINVQLPVEQTKAKVCLVCVFSAVKCPHWW